MDTLDIKNPGSTKNMPHGEINIGEALQLNCDEPGCKNSGERIETAPLLERAATQGITGTDALTTFVRQQMRNISRTQGWGIQIAMKDGVSTVHDYCPEHAKLHLPRFANR